MSSFIETKNFLITNTSAFLGTPVYYSPPYDSAEALATVVSLGGPMLYLAGHLLFKWSLSGKFLITHLVGLVILVVLLLVGLVAPMPTLVVGAAETILVLTVAVWDTLILWGSARQYL